ncbi:peritrophin-1 [Elysia marginata]|uniref:Peritrophin-1 n=1 Tax=Elysia marginata TaxID=1093978 RepID=A0AAV4K2T9_9GAST|nr:peritrophin-1 [Elysia marginata]
MALRLALFLAVIAAAAASPRCPQEANAPSFLYADPDDCTKFYMCSGGVNIPMSCPANLRFSNVNMTCAHPGSVHDTCGNPNPNPNPPTPAASTSSGSGPSSTTPNPYAAKNQCPKGPNPPPHLYADPDDCSQFFMCSNGVNILLACPSGLHFSNYRDTCVHRGSSYDECEVEQAIRKCREGSADVLPHPHICHAYFNCSKDPSRILMSNFKPFEMECRFPEVFDPSTKQCVGRRSATCDAIRKTTGHPCDYRYWWCRTRYCVPPCLRAASCIGQSDGFHAHSGGQLNRYVLCQDEYVVSIRQCPVSDIFSEDQGTCVPFNPQAQIP